ncbi:hypothetical protein EW146_g10301 [Bondarzewia mesenterica]|uniref:alpha-galactosidase n=1 Tax=Bondarzewia mesenterica TaxID=1095465 RepID=A0A4S4L3B2_9AGAM|nr:hypothetical protein EW146_g10301 [Bondarzewia mesenterica]
MTLTFSLSVLPDDRGNGDLTFEESKTHFTAWALMKSPLLIGTDLPSITSESLEILTNKEIIAISQDPVVGTGVTPFRWGINPDWTLNASYPAQYWSGKSQNGTVFMLLNFFDEPADMFFSLTESPWIRAGRQYSVRDLWAHTNNGTAVRNFTAKAVPPHGVAALLLQDAGDEPGGIYPPCAVIEWCMAPNGTRLHLSGEEYVRTLWELPSEPEILVDVGVDAVRGGGGVVGESVSITGPSALS